MHEHDRHAAAIVRRPREATVDRTEGTVRVAAADAVGSPPCRCRVHLPPRHAARL